MSGKKKSSGAGPQVDPQQMADALAGAAPPPPAPEATVPGADPTDTVTMYQPGGTAVEVPLEQAQQAYQSKQLGFAEGQKIAVRDRSGRMLETDASNADQVLGGDSEVRLAGNQEVAQAKEAVKYGTIGKGAAAFGAGAARGLTFGLSDVAATAIGGEGTRQELSKLREHNPIVSGAGEVAGAIAPVLLTGGAAAPEEAAALGAGEAARGAGVLSRTIGAAGVIPRAVARVGEAAAGAAEGVVGTGAKGLIGKVAQRAIPMAAQGAAEGGIYGAGQAVSEAALGDHELNAEKLLAASAHGAFFGAAGGALLGAGEVVAKAGFDKAFKLAGESGLEDWLQSFADNRTIKALGASQRDISRLGKTGEQATERMGEIAKTVRSYQFENGEKLFGATASVEDLAQGTRRAIDEQTAKLDSVRKQVSGLIEAKPALAPDVQGFLQKVDTDVLAPLRESNVASVSAKANKVEREIEMLRSKVTPAGIAEDHPLAEVFRNAQAGNEQAAKMIEVAKAKDPALRAALEPQGVTIDELTQMRKDLDSIIYPKTNSGVPPPAPEHQAELLKVRGLLEETVENATERAARESGKPELYRDLVDAKQKIHDLIPANQMAERWVTRDIGNRAVSPTDYGMGGSVVAGMLAGGHGGPAAALAGGATAFIHHVVRERGSAVLASAAEKLAQLSAIRRATLEVDKKIESGVSSFLSRETSVGSRAAPATVLLTNRGQAREKVFETRQQQVAELGNPAAHAERVASMVAPIGTHAPLTAAAVSQKASVAAENLQKMMPKAPPNPSLLQPQLHKVRFPESEMAKFARYAAVVKDPLSTLEDMRKGRLSREAVQALQDNSPGLLEQMKAETMKQLAERKTELPYEKRIQLGILLGVATDPTLEPAFVQSIRSMYDETAAKAPQPGQSGGAAKSGAKRPAKELAGDVALPAQQLQRAAE